MKRAGTPKGSNASKVAVGGGVEVGGAAEAPRPRPHAISQLTCWGRGRLSGSETLALRLGLRVTMVAAHQNRETLSSNAERRGPGRETHQEQGATSWTANDYSRER